MAKIILMADGVILQHMTLVKDRITIGRRPSNDIVIDHLSISGQHAAITTIADDAFLEDLGSTNGTLVNGQLVKKHFLQDGDVIELAKYRIKYQTEAQSGSSQHDNNTAANTLTQTTQAYNPSTINGLDDGYDALRPASIKILSGSHSGKQMPLAKAFVTIGRPGIAVAAITRSPQGYAITHIEGAQTPIVNGQPIGAAAHALQDGDVLNLADTEMQFIFG